MKPAGLVAVQAAKTDGRWDAAYPPQSDPPFPKDLRRALTKTRGRKHSSLHLPAQHLYRLYHVTDVEKPANRIAEYLRLLSKRRALS
jgi:uncharacterized protein YdeI (YjbR/CyaY-like superfamily)